MTDRQLAVEPPLPGTAVERRPAPEVRCRRCNRPLHRPESRWEKLGAACAAAPDRRAVVYEIDQDQLPLNNPHERLRAAGTGGYGGPGCCAAQPTLQWPPTRRSGAAKVPSGSVF